ncbi:hypothetical protein Tco_1469819 [Tanacetum coccineum]
MMAARYPDFGLELLVSEHMWIDDVCTYDISATYGISHWWFNRQKFYIDRRDSPSRRKEVRTHMRILTVIRVKAYSRYGSESASSARSSRSSTWFRQTYAIYCCQTMDLKLSDLTVVVFPVDNNDRKIMRFNEIYKFSDGTLTRILEALDYRVKEFKVKRLNEYAILDSKGRDKEQRVHKGY